MTREQQVRAALKLIAPPASERAACRADIENRLNVIESFGEGDKVFAGARSEAATKALAAYHDALGRLRTTYKAVLAAGGGRPLRRAADGSWREVLTLADIDFLIEASKPPPKQVVYSVLSPRKGRPLPDILPDGALATFGAGKPTKAAELSHELLRRWGRGIKIVTTRDKVWHKLTAIMYGDPKADLYQYLRLVRRYLLDEKGL
jgi:hypothetical protein